MGERTVSLDEMTGIQALERKAPDLPMRPGKIHRREFEYIRHGTQTLIASFDVAQGQVIAASVGETRTEADYLAQVQHTVGTDPKATKWHLGHGLLKYPSIGIAGALCRPSRGIGH
ncbi:transposase [Leptolyngbya sp. BC1307]|uniref:transposase n=1 Tax=Leptolyngbya sp. BC1307 TaxID=2029589 RepID=UPI00197D088E|nr:transposase [Leptolyngbya sp. BC1307]